MKITKIWFTADHIFGRDEEGKEYSQSLLWYPKLRAASDEERSQYTDGIHWRSLDEDISFESFTYEDSEPSALQRFFLTHKEINVAEFARSIGMNATLLRNYINGFKKPSAERESEILAHIHKLGKETHSLVMFNRDGMRHQSVSPHNIYETMSRSRKRMPGSTWCCCKSQNATSSWGGTRKVPSHGDNSCFTKSFC